MLCRRGVDLNRDFPDPITSPAMVPSGREQPEVAAVMNWTLSTPGGFVASAGLHEVGGGRWGEGHLLEA